VRPNPEDRHVLRAVALDIIPAIRAGSISI
jgi:hypothetical protein